LIRRDRLALHDKKRGCFLEKRRERELEEKEERLASQLDQNVVKSTAQFDLLLITSKKFGEVAGNR
jgi:hypothetical protein